MRWIPPVAEALLVAGCLPATAWALEPPAAGPGIATSVEVPLFLDVRLNQQDTGKVLPFVQREGGLWAAPDTLRQLGFALPADQPADLVDLRTLSGVRIAYDVAMQKVAIDAPLALLSLEATMLGTAGVAAPPASNSPGLLLNYNLFGNHDQVSDNATGYLELRAFGGNAGVLSTSLVSRTYRFDGGDWRGDTVRLDSSWQWSFQDRMTTLVVGDTYTGNLGWTRAVRLGGVRFGRDFSLQPYRTTSPLPMFAGEVVVPSEVELYINGIRQYAGEVPVGPFRINSQPSINGAGNAQLVIRDAFGAVRTVNVPFYSTPNLLSAGLSDWSVVMGMVREDYGVRSFSYADRPVGSADYRRGISDRLTVEAHAEGSDTLANAGVGALWSLGAAGVIGASYAHSEQHGRTGEQAGLAYNWTNSRFTFSIDSRRTHGDYRDIASSYGFEPARISERGLAGWNSDRLGSFGVSYARLQQLEEEDDRYGSAYWSHSFGGRWSLSFNYNQNLDDNDDRSFFLGFSLSLDSGRMLNVSGQRNGNRDVASIDLTKAVPGDGGFGWRLRADHGEGDTGGLAELGWLGRHAQLYGGLGNSGGNTYSYASGSGSLVLMEYQVFAARSISDAFAVVSTSGVGGVPVKLENRPIGVTNEKGLLLVTPLNAWQRNLLAIDPMDLPANMRLGKVEMNATPTDRAGTAVRFDVERVRAALLVLQDHAGQPLPLGSRVQLIGGSAQQALVGYDGETYLDTLETRNTMEVTTTQGRCRIHFDYPAVPDAIPRIGPLTCTPEKQP
ncbi:outer membrane usher protein [Luteimonas cucumeris]|uniref:Outer membrane usher protein n=1 Tax=Luteimonas cucumeris TaxID=985012 RepID=A0A562LB70_9GAMM|nr:fimbria/pilus outer membrane usher protein [Luteimonas cucumeris]TWI04907.1 outer membrane usher protein [Luteimonas cucumeris]